MSNTWSNTPSNLPPKETAASALSSPQRLPVTPPSLPTDVQLRLAATAERAPALRMILGTAGLDADDERVADFLHHCLLRKIDLTQLSVAALNDKLIWALLPIYSPGHNVLLLAPSRLESQETAVAEALIHFTLAQHPGLLLAQTLIDPHTPALAAPFYNAGFTPLATLHYLQRTLRAAPQPPAPHAPAFEAHTYSPATHDLFRAALAASYEGSLDCPAIEGIRNLDDILASHKAAGGSTANFDPSLWTVLTCDNAPAAVLLLGPPNGAGDHAMELVYLGVAPAFRGKSLGKHLLRLALHLTWQRDCKQLTLAVDAANTPALRLYHGLGFARVHDRLALMRDLRDTTTSATAASPHAAANSSHPFPHPTSANVS